jgi:hypothetical protein
MGYTHYWKSARAIKSEAVEPFIAAVKAVLAHPACPAVCYEYDEPFTPAQVNTDGIRFNGPDEDGCETFYLNLTGPTKFEFTKTRMRPYDTAVTAILTLAHHLDPDWLDISSDGDATDWVDGVALARIAAPGALNPIDPTCEAPQSTEEAAS